VVSKGKFWAATLSSIIIIVGALLGFLYWYGNQSDIPNGLRLYNRSMGGITWEQWKGEWKTKIEALQTKQIAIQYKGDTRTHSIKELGGTTNADVLYQHTAQVLNNTILKPGEIFDYRKVIQGIETKYGYKPAPEIVNGQLQQGIGGWNLSSIFYTI
jgi:hypothetical protein